MAGPPRASRLPKVDPAITRLVAGIIATAVLVWVGTRAARRATSARSELRLVEATLADFADLRKRYAPAVAAESIAWRRTMMELQDLGVGGDERLALTQSVALAAESAGLENVKVLIGEADTTARDGRPSRGGVGRKSASFGLTVEGRGGMAALLTFLGRLPRSVDATQVGMVRHPSEGASHRVSLVVYELTFDNDPSSGLRTPGERDAARGGGAARPGG